MRAPCTKRIPTTRASTKLRKHARQIRVHAAAATHVRRLGHAILVLAQIVPFAPVRIRQHRVSLHDQLELFLVAALKKTKTVPLPFQYANRVGFMASTLSG